MAIGLAISKIGFHRNMMEKMQQYVDAIENKVSALNLDAARRGTSPDPAATEQFQIELAIYKFLHGFHKDQVQFWEDVIKDTLAFLKSLNELAQGAR